MTLNEKEIAFEKLLIDRARTAGYLFLWESAAGNDEERENIYLEDVCGWLVPIGIPEEQWHDDKFYVCAEWKDVGGEIEIEFQPVEVFEVTKENLIAVANKKMERGPTHPPRA